MYIKEHVINKIKAKTFRTEIVVLIIFSSIPIKRTDVYPCSKTIKVEKDGIRVRERIRIHQSDKP